MKESRNQIYLEKPGTGKLHPNKPSVSPNGYGFVQDGHSYSVAGLAGHRLGGFSLMSVRPNYRSWVRITNAEDIFCRPACIKLMLAVVLFQSE